MLKVSHLSRSKTQYLFKEQATTPPLKLYSSSLAVADVQVVSSLLCAELGAHEFESVQI